MRRLALAVAMLAVAGPPNARAASAVRVACTDYCGEKAAGYCDRIDSWRCTWYILGCLAGCNIASL